MTNREYKALKFLREISPLLYRFEYSDVKPWLDTLILQVPVPTFTTDTIGRFKEDIWYRNPSILYRSRENLEAIRGYSLPPPYKKVSEISLNPNQQNIRTYGRCNLPYESRFYCSNFMPAASIECLTNGFVKNISESKAVTSGSWHINNPLILTEIPCSRLVMKDLKMHDLDRYNAQMSFTEKWYTHTLSMIKVEGGFSEDYAKELFELFSDEFAKIEINNCREYILSNYFCDHVFNRTILKDRVSKVDGIIYPSVKYSLQEYNLVLHPRAMKKLAFACASNVWVIYDSPPLNRFEFHPLETGFKDMENDGFIKWNIFGH